MVRSRSAFNQINPTWNGGDKLNLCDKIVENNIVSRRPEPPRTLRSSSRTDSELIVDRNRTSIAAPTLLAAPPAVAAPPMLKAPAPTAAEDAPIATMAKRNPAVEAYIRFVAVPRFNEFRVSLPPAEFAAGVRKVHIDNPSLLLHPRSTLMVIWDLLLSCAYHKPSRMMKCQFS